MHRRSFLKTVTAAAAAAMVPSWLLVGRRRLDLRPFCRASCCVVSSGKRYDLSHPFVQGDHAYATDAHICVQANPQSAGQRGSAVGLPPAEDLPWDAAVRGWQPWPERPEYLVADYSTCLTCGNRGPRTECAVCDGTGSRCRHCQDKGDWCGLATCSGYSVQGAECRACRGKGWVGKDCPACGGCGWWKGPGLQVVGDHYVEAFYDSLVRKHLGPCDYVSVDWPTAGVPVLLLRGDNWRALLCTIWKDRAEMRLTCGK